MVTNDLKTFEEELDGKGYDVDLRYLVRCLTAVATGQSRFRALGTAEPKAIELAWVETRKALQYFLNLARENLGLESWDWVPSTNALICAGGLPGPTAVRGRGPDAHAALVPTLVGLAALQRCGRDGDGPRTCACSRNPIPSTRWSAC